MIYKNISLKKYNTFGLNYTAGCLIGLETEEEAIKLLKSNSKLKPPLLILGSGSNLLFTSDFKGTILHPEIGGIEIEETEINHGYVIISAGAGVIWDDLVAWVVDKGFGGFENLSLIPGKVGASPIQNIGAYGVEIKDMIVSVRTIDTVDGSIRIFDNSDCEFSYRNSVFKNNLKGRYLVTRVFYKLSIEPRLNLSYGSLIEEVNKLGKVNLKNVRQGVINIRRSKLPDPEIIGNAGSFFKNPVVKNSVALNLKKRFPSMPVYEDQKGYMKLASGWFIDQCGWKGKRRGYAGVHDKQALVLVNHGKASGEEIYVLSEEIKMSVLKKFGIVLEREVEVVGAI